MKLASVTFIIINISLIKSANPDDSTGVLFYEELGCKAVYSILPFLPTKYSCPKYTYSPGTCLSKGITYIDGEIINGTSRCNSCYCSAPKKKPGKIICSKPRCAQISVQKPCWVHYDLNDCCPKKWFCPHASMKKCNVCGEVCNEGQYLRPRDTCWECVCDKGFKLYDKRFCRRMRCDLVVNHYEKLVKCCIPLYKTDAKDRALCCPTDFICAEDITSMEIAGQSLLKMLKHFILRLFKLATYCRVGGKVVIVGDEFKLKLKDNKFRGVHCKCLKPPFPICVVH